MNKHKPTPKEHFTIHPSRNSFAKAKPDPERVRLKKRLDDALHERELKEIEREYPW